jgi:putative DNA primase/helicase
VQHNVSKTPGKRTSKAQSESTTSFHEDWEIKAWPEPVHPGTLLTDIETTIRRYIVCEPETATAAALWIAMTYLVDVVDVLPLAVITAPERGCGKSTMLDAIGRMVNKPFQSAGITASALFRTISEHQPTMLIDETDAFMKGDEKLRGIINSGHRRRDAHYTISEQTRDGGFITRRFSTWGAKALSGIGKLADTLMDRAIILELRRKLPCEHVEQLRDRTDREGFETLKRKLARFANDYRETISVSEPYMPPSLSGRQADNWEPLLAIADCAGGAWADKARQTAIAMTSTDSVSSIGETLLADIREVFEEKGKDRLSREELMRALLDDKEKPWATYNRGWEMTPNQFAQRLKGYGIKIKVIRFGHATQRGFEIGQFQEAFERYLANPCTPSFPGKSVTMEEIARKASTGAGFSVTGDSVTDCNVTDEAVTGETAGYASVPVKDLSALLEAGDITEGEEEAELEEGVSYMGNRPLLLDGKRVRLSWEGI